jgi:heme A synthase
VRTIRTLAIATALATYGLIVLGAVVRITGSGMGCGDHWPLCNGRLIPSLRDLPTLIEWTHRLVALMVSGLVVGLGALALARRAEPHAGGPGGPLRPALLSVALLAAQVMLGAVTVWLELPPATVTLHLATAMALLAAVVVTALRAGPDQRATQPGDARLAAWMAAALGGVAILLGGATASLGAGPSCQGFPLCSGQLWPAGRSGWPTIHWIHRLAAYSLVAYLLVYALGPARRLPAGTARMAWLACGLAVMQVAVAAAMVLLALPLAWRALHAAVGTAVWAVLVWWAWSAAPAPRTSTAAGTS